MDFICIHVKILIINNIAFNLFLNIHDDLMMIKTCTLLWPLPFTKIYYINHTRK